MFQYAYFFRFQVIISHCGLIQFYVFYNFFHIIMLTNTLKHVTIENIKILSDYLSTDEPVFNDLYSA